MKRLLHFLESYDNRLLPNDVVVPTPELDELAGERARLNRALADATASRWETPAKARAVVDEVLGNYGYGLSGDVEEPAEGSVSAWSALDLTKDGDVVGTVLYGVYRVLNGYAVRLTVV